MERTYLKDLAACTGKLVTVNGFIQALRDQGGIKFALLRDITGLAQLVFLKTEVETFQKFKELSLESVVEVEGLVKAEKQAPGGYEIQVVKLTILSHAAPELPIPVVEEKGGEPTEVAKRLDFRWIDLRKKENTDIFKVWTALEKGFRKYFDEAGYLQVYAPNFMNTASETGAEVFKVDYFDRPAYLAQSPQFYKQMAMASGFERIFMTGPYFRAEQSFTTRHLTEFTGWDFEISYINSHYDLMAEEEKLIVSGFEEVKKSTETNVEIPTIPFPKITLKDAKVKLATRGIPNEKPNDLSPEEERVLSQIILEETGSDFVFVVDYPIESRAFYHMRHADNPGLTKSFDLMYRGVEITTGAQREHRVEVLEKQALEKGMTLEALADYLNFFRFGCPPHGGAGIGPARIIMRLLNIPSVKEATFLPRDVKRLRP